MERKRGFFSALRELSPAKSRSQNTVMGGVTTPRSKSLPEPPPVARSGGKALAPLMEGPDPGEGRGAGAGEGRKDGLGQWMRTQFSKAPAVARGHRRSDLRLLLGVMGAPLAPIHAYSGEPLPHLSIKDTPIETSSAQYILQQYTAASGGTKLLSSIHSSYAMGKTRMTTSEFETSAKVMKNRNASSDSESGRFVLWRMSPDMWYVELAVGASKIQAGCDGKIVWRNTPWLSAHAAKGPVRPLRRALQGLDPLTTASMFASARCIGEADVGGEECFVLKLYADPQTLKARSEGPAEIIRHVMFGHFSQKTGLLVHMEDSHLTRVESNSGGEAVFWETTISSFLDDYRAVEGVVIAHSGRSIVTLFRFGEAAMSHTRTRMEEAWSVEEVAFNVPGLSTECFIPPADLNACGLRRERGKAAAPGLSRAKVAALERQQHSIATAMGSWKVVV